MTTQTPTEGQIRICEEGPEPSDGRIVICDPAPEPTEGKIVICVQQADCPEGTPSLSISGTETPNDGSAYTVSGGVGPFSWSISKGSIGPTGPRTATVTVSGQCGGATITVTDTVCGVSVSKSVRYPTGQWVPCGSIAIGDHTYNGSTCYFGIADWPYYYEGHYRYDGRIMCIWPESDCGASTGDTGGHDCISLASAVVEAGICTGWTCVGSTRQASATICKWECP